MNSFLWALQILGAVIYTASGYMKLFMFDQISAEVPTFGALPRQVWMGLGVMELISVVGLILPSALRWHPWLTVASASILALESLLFVWVHVQYKEVAPIAMSAMLGLLMAFIAYGRQVVKPLL